MALEPKPMSGSELGARFFVLEAFVIALAKAAPQLPENLRDEAMKAVRAFNRPEMMMHAEQYADELYRMMGKNGGRAA